MTLKFDRWPWKTVEHISYATSGLVYHFVTTCEFKPSYGPETAKLGFDLCDLDLWSLTLTFCMDITFANSNHSWKFHDNTMRGTMSKRCDRHKDRQTDGQTDRQTGWIQYTPPPPPPLTCRGYDKHRFVSTEIISVILIIHLVEYDCIPLTSVLQQWLIYEVRIYDKWDWNPKGLCAP